MKCRVNVFMFKEIIQSSTIRNLKNSVESLHVGICSLVVKTTRSRRFQWFLRVFVSWKKHRALINQLHHNKQRWLQTEITTTPTIETKKCVPLFSSIPDAVLLMFFGFGHHASVGCFFLFTLCTSPFEGSLKSTTHFSLFFRHFLALMRENYVRQKTIRAFKKGLVDNWKYCYHDLWFKRIDSY